MLILIAIFLSVDFDRNFSLVLLVFVYICSLAFVVALLLPISLVPSLVRHIIMQGRGDGRGGRGW